jgi:hypothetical protein
MGARPALSRQVRERQGRAREAVKKQERAEREQERALGEHKREHREPVLALDYNCSVVCYVCFSQDYCLNSLVSIDRCRPTLRLKGTKTHTHHHILEVFVEAHNSFLILKLFLLTNRHK